MADRVLVVEDEEDLRHSVAEVLRLEGYDVSTAANGQEALEELQNGDGRPSLILLDMMMPVMDGWTFRRRQLEDPELADIPVVVFTSAKNVDENQDLDVSVVLEKPVGIDRLVEVVEEHI
ncbi:MAG: response regulator [Bradymonadaceae bacterium]